jgi:hypothetical protein
MLSTVTKPNPRPTVEGQKLLKVLIEKYGMTRDNAIKLMHDGGAPMAVALLFIARGMP